MSIITVNVYCRFMIVPLLYWVLAWLKEERNTFLVKMLYDHPGSCPSILPVVCHCLENNFVAHGDQFYNTEDGTDFHWCTRTLQSEFTALCSTWALAILANKGFAILKRSVSIELFRLDYIHYSNIGSVKIVQESGSNRFTSGIEMIHHQSYMENAELHYLP